VNPKQQVEVGRGTNGRERQPRPARGRSADGKLTRYSAPQHVPDRRRHEAMMPRALQKLRGRTTNPLVKSASIWPERRKSGLARKLLLFMNI
jgi:hypothetical protein